MKKDILSNVTRSLNKVKFGVKKHSPEILIVTGVAGVIASAVMACKATTKIGKVADDHKKQINEVHDSLELFTVRLVFEVVFAEQIIVYHLVQYHIFQLFLRQVILGVQAYDYQFVPRIDRRLSGRPESDAAKKGCYIAQAECGSRQ